MSKKATIIAVVNQKGGTGKTTTTENLGVGLALEGKKVLLVDTDPQASLTVSLGNPCQRIDGQHTQRRHTVKKNVIIILFDCIQVLPENGFPAHGIDQCYLHT